MIRKSMILLWLAVSTATATFAADVWPKKIPLKSGGEVVIYQPQNESLEGDVLTARAAIMVKETGKSEPVFGAIWAKANLLTNRDTRMATLESLEIADLKFPEVEDQAKLDKLKALLENAAANSTMEISLDNIIATLESKGQTASENYNTEAPKIIYEEQPSMLIIFDGEPRLEMDDEMGLNRVKNTPFLIVQDPENKKYYLYGGAYWYESTDVKSGYKNTRALPSTIQSMDEAIKKAEKEAKQETPKPITPPAIITTTEPAELIQSNGPAEYNPVDGTQLLYMSNTADDILMDINSQTHYVLLSGRWYSGKGLNGPWTYVAADALPEDFAKIPEGSEVDNVLSSVAGTDAAQESLLDTEIPQTAKIDRNSTDCTVQYDGKPKFESIQGTDMFLAVNADKTVIRSDNKYYVVDNGVWFMSVNEQGPWTVSTERPSQVDKIPPENQAHNVKYVYVYDVTPTYVYCGYTAGYMGSYIYGPTVIYGTGWYYRPWYGTYYYPRPYTYGFGMHYNPWTGWSMSFGYSTGWFNFSFHVGGGYGGWWGPPVYRPPYRYPYRATHYGGNNRIVRNTNINVGDINIDNSRDININRDRTNNLYNQRKDAQTRDRDRSKVNDRSARNTNTSNIQNRAGNVDRSNVQNRASQVDRSRVDNTRKKQAKPAPKVNNNVYADRNGNVHRQTNNGQWQSRDRSGWNNSGASQQMNRAAQQRSRGQTRTQSFQRAAPARAAGGGRTMRRR